MKFLASKPNIEDWFKNPPDSIPKDLTEFVDCEHAFKITILSPDFAFIYDKNLFDVHALFNGEGGTWLYMNGRMNDKNFEANNTDDNVKLICKWD